MSPFKKYYTQPTHLTFCPEIGMGYYPVKSNEAYDDAYFAKYVKYASTPVGRDLTKARVDLVKKYIPIGMVLDVGIGAGSFIEAHGLATGYDVSRLGVDWLIARDKMWDPGGSINIRGICFWDSLEHIEDPTMYFDQRTHTHMFISCPIYLTAEHIVQSKHFRPTEHCWYHTSLGLIKMMQHLGYHLLDYNRMEEALGREDIGTFVFARN